MKEISQWMFVIAWFAGCTTVTKPPALTIWDAAELGRVEVIRQHLNVGTDLNTLGGITGLTALHQASFHGRVEIALLLIKAGADVNVVSRLGETPLHSCVYWEHLEIAELLLANGAVLDAKLESGQTPLEWAEQLGASRMVELFSSHAMKFREK